MQPTPQPKIADAIHVAARACGVAPDDIRGGRRFRDVAIARRGAMWLARTTTAASYSQIARALGGMHHTSVIYGYRTMERMCADDAVLQDYMAQLAEQVRARAAGRPVVEREPPALVVTRPLAPARSEQDVSAWRSLGGDLEFAA